MTLAVRCILHVAINQLYIEMEFVILATGDISLYHIEHTEPPFELPIIQLYSMMSSQFF